ncbi:MAG TPA: MATE family efflux transporter [Mycobacteriales bacterium]|nr:MATE family efflux transporter [Mycobacteriales bacterium]
MSGISIGDRVNDPEPQLQQTDPVLRRRITRLAGPMAIAELLGLIVPLGVIALMGHMGDDALYVRSLYMPLAFLFLAIQTAFDISNQVTTATNAGRGRHERGWASASTMAVLWAATGLVVLIALLVAAPGLADLLHVQQHARGDFTSFLRWMALANITLLAPVLCASTLRGFGLPRRSMLVTLTAATVELGTVGGLGLAGGMGVDAVPIACALAGACGGTLGLVLLRRHGLWRPGERLVWCPDSLVTLRQVGLPVGASYLVMFGSNLALLWVLNPYGPTVISGYSIAGSLQSAIIMPGLVVGSATAIVMNHQRGAATHALLPRTLRCGLQLTLAAYLVIVVVVWFGRHGLAGLATDNSRVADVTAHYLAIVGLTYLLMGLVLTATTIMEQIGASLPALLLNVAYFGGVVVVGGILTRHLDDPDALYKTIAGFNLCGVLAVGIAVWAVRRAARAGESG